MEWKEALLDPDHWVTATRKIVPITTMNDGHLLNTVRMIRRHVDERELVMLPCYPTMMAEVHRRGLSAQLEHDPYSNKNSGYGARWQIIKETWK